MTGSWRGAFALVFASLLLVTSGIDPTYAGKGEPPRKTFGSSLNRATNNPVDPKAGRRLTRWRWSGALPTRLSTTRAELSGAHGPELSRIIPSIPPVAIADAHDERGEQSGESSGSGIYLGTAGFEDGVPRVLTNQHVVEGATEVTLVFPQANPKGRWNGVRVRAIVEAHSKTEDLAVL